MVNMGNTEKRWGVCLPVMGTMRVSLAFGFLLWVSALVARADRYVVEPGTPGGTNAGAYTNWTIAATQIQWAVTAASAGETVWVTNGTYYLTNEISVGNVILQSVNGQENTFINGNYPAYTNRCLNINNAAAVVKGFTIMNSYFTNWSPGYYQNGGGVYMAAGTLRNCHITTNVGILGGGIYMAGTASIYDSIISSNSLITNGLGGGIFIMGVNCIISNCVFWGNIASYCGGGLCIYGEGMVNRAATVINCSFISNRAPNIGGGIYCSGANSIIRNCIFYGNSSGWIGGLMDIYARDTKIQNCTLVRNGSDGLYRFGSDGGLVENCIIISNSYTPNAITTNRNNRTDTTITVGVNTNNITNNPSFVNYAADNYRLANNSPCINTGTNQDWTTNAVDLDGRTRLRYGTVDMGAYEHITAGAVFGVR